MKRVGHLYETMCDIDFIKKAIRNAAKGKTDRAYISRILADIDRYAQELKQMLEAGDVVLSPSQTCEIYDNSCRKRRIITIPKFYPDQIIHWLVITAIQPVIMRGMYRYCCGSIPNRGGIDAKAYVETAIHDGKCVIAQSWIYQSFSTASARPFCSICYGAKSKTRVCWNLSAKYLKTAATTCLLAIIRRNGFQIFTWRDSTTM